MAIRSAYVATLGAAAMVWIAAIGCGSSTGSAGRGGGPACGVPSTRDCECSGGFSGSQSCVADGSGFGECKCGGAGGSFSGGGGFGGSGGSLGGPGEPCADDSECKSGFCDTFNQCA